MSPIHDQSYRHYAGARRPLGRAWTVIAMAGMRSALRRRWLVAVLLFAWIVFIVRTVHIYVVTMYPAMNSALPVDARTFQQFVEWQSFFGFFVTIFVGSGLIANDRRANALQIYLSKPLLRMEYIGGKLAVLAGFLLFVTLVPGLLLIVMQVLFAGNLDFLRANPYVIPAVILSCLMQVTVSSFTMLALSSLSKSTRYVAILYTGVIFFTNVMYGVLLVVTGSSRVAWISVGANLENVSDALFRQPHRYDAPVLVSLMVLLGLLAVSISVLERRVRGVEIVS